MILFLFLDGFEDHDFQEISHTTIFGKKFSIEDTHDTIAVGRLKSSVFQSLHEEVKEFFKTDEKFKILEDLFEKAMSFDLVKNYPFLGSSFI